MPSFPTFTNGVITAYPYGESDLFNTTQSYMPCGVTYTHAWNPSNRQRRFAVQFEVITKPEMLTLEAFWHSVDGQVGSFSFVDDQGVTHTNSRFDQDKLDLLYTDAGQYGFRVLIRALN